jgi:hypothetical protein
MITRFSLYFSPGPGAWNLEDLRPGGMTLPVKSHQAIFAGNLPFDI